MNFNVDGVASQVMLENDVDKQILETDASSKNEKRKMS